MPYDYDNDDNYRERDNAKSGYECQHCGYEPTWKETDRGTCPRCGPGRRERKDAVWPKAEPSKTTSPGDEG